MLDGAKRAMFKRKKLRALWRPPLRTSTIAASLAILTLSRAESREAGSSDTAQCAYSLYLALGVVTTFGIAGWIKAKVLAE